MHTHQPLHHPGPRGVLITVLALALAGGCGAHPMVLRPVPAAQTQDVPLCEPPRACSGSVELTYLGVGGWVIRSGGSAVMTAPAFTHPNQLRTVLPFLPLRTDEHLARQRLQAVRLDGLDAILVGHSHYDHLMDVPFVAREFARDVPIYGSPTMAHLLAGDTALRQRARAVADHVAGGESPGRWIYAADSSIRYLPLRSTHAPNVWKYTFANRTRSTARESSLPRTARGWWKGEVYAWLIDVVGEDGAPRFRIYYQDAAADSASLALPRFEGADARAVDLAILCVGNYDKVQDSPAVALRLLQPRYVVLGHWENFFRDGRDAPRIIPFTKAGELVKQMDLAMDKRWAAPEPMSRFVVRY